MQKLNNIVKSEVFFFYLIIYEQISLTPIMKITYSKFISYNNAFNIYNKAMKQFLLSYLNFKLIFFSLILISDFNLQKNEQRMQLFY